jgi:hypothetical protein
MTTNAAQIWPHLKTGERPEQQQRAPTLAAALYPALPPQPRAPDDWQAYRDWLLAFSGLRRRIDVKS